MVFDPSMHDSVRHRVETELALRYALDRDELLLHYQPIVSVQTGEVVGAEALLRWAHPSLGLVSPLDFIPIAEETGLIVEIGEWVVSEALRQAARWREQRAGTGLPETCGSRSTSRPASCATRRWSTTSRPSCCAGTACPPSLLVLEITESAMMADEDVAATLLHRLRDARAHPGRRRLRHRLLVTGPPAPVPRVQGEDRPGVRRPASSTTRTTPRSCGRSSRCRWPCASTSWPRASRPRVSAVLLQQLGVQLGQGWHFGRPMPAEDCAFVPALSRSRAKS